MLVSIAVLNVIVKLLFCSGYTITPSALVAVVFKLGYVSVVVIELMLPESYAKYELAIAVPSTNTSTSSIVVCVVEPAIALDTAYRCVGW